MRIIDFVGLGDERVIYVIYRDKVKIWAGTRQEFVHELSAFFGLFYLSVIRFNIESKGVIHLYT